MHDPTAVPNCTVLVYAEVLFGSHVPVIPIVGFWRVLEGEGWL